MSSLPLFLELEGVPVLLVGSGPAALRKLGQLAATGARITVLAGSDQPPPAAWRNHHKVAWKAKPFDREMPNPGYRLIVTAAEPATNAQVAAWGEEHAIWVNAVDDPRHSTTTWPAIVDRSPIQVAIGSGGAAPVLARRIRELLERLLPERLGAVAEVARRLRGRVARRLAPAYRRPFWEGLFDPLPEDPERFREAAEQALTQGCRPRVGRVDLVGAGPGDPDLLTLRAQRVLQTADVIVHDRLVDARILARGRRDALYISVGKAPGRQGTSQDAINRLLIDRARRGEHVCRLKGGDPTVFARAGEELAALAKAEIPHQIVPGITAAIGSAASLGISLTHRDRAHALVLATAQGKDEDALQELASLAGSGRTLAVYMGVTRLRELQHRLLERGVPGDLPAAIVENASRPEERRFWTNVNDLVREAEKVRLASPALIIVGATAERPAASAKSTGSRSRARPLQSAP
ncbi:MAG: siroheme synthase CysG [Xanthomonadales bacterium]|nr:siroheme synthase CysG [Xanthomonadales bacterium]